MRNASCEKPSKIVLPIVYRLRVRRILYFYTKWKLSLFFKFSTLNFTRLSFDPGGRGPQKKNKKKKLSQRVIVCHNIDFTTRPTRRDATAWGANSPGACPLVARSGSGRRAVFPGPSSRATVVGPCCKGSTRGWLDPRTPVLENTHWPSLVLCARRR